MDQITRGEGHAVLNNAAYRAGAKFVDERYGEVWDYTRKGGVIYTEIMLPEHAPERFLDREVLWNEVEEVEKHPRAQLAHNIEFSLQNELTLEENIEVAKKFVQETFIAKGMIVDLCVHNPARDDDEEPDNPHIHLLIPIRPLNEDGTWGNKQRREYHMDDTGDPILDARGKKTFTAVSTTGWSTKEALFEYREKYAFYFNEKFKEKGLTCRLDHRSYVEQGIPLIPQIHEGPAVGKMEKRGIRTEKRAINLLIKSINEALLQVRDLINRFQIYREEIHKIFAEQEREPNIVELMNAYFEHRKKVASTYKYGRQKAEVKNIQLRVDMYSNLKDRDISSLDQLHDAIERLDKRLGFTTSKISKQVHEIKKLENLLRLNDYYKEYRPLFLQMQKIKFKMRRNKFQEEHKAELNKYFAADNKLKPYVRDGKLPVSEWKKELENLQQVKSEDLAERDVILQELKVLRKIYDALEHGLAILKGDPSSADQKETQKKKSIKEKLESNKQQVAMQSPKSEIKKTQEMNL